MVCGTDRIQPVSCVLECNSYCLESFANNARREKRQTSPKKLNFPGLAHLSTSTQVLRSKPNKTPTDSSNLCESRDAVVCSRGQFVALGSRMPRAHGRPAQCGGPSGILLIFHLRTNLHHWVQPTNGLSCSHCEISTRWAFSTLSQCSQSSLSKSAEASTREASGVKRLM